MKNNKSIYSLFTLTNRGVYSFLLTFYLIILFSIHSSDASLLERKTITDHWFGAELEEKGLGAELIYTGEFAKLGTGGEKETKGLYLDNIDLMFTFNTEKSGLWKNGTFFIYLLSNHGDNPTEFVGDMQVTSNIEANNTTRLYEFWYEHQFLDGKVSALMGLFDLNSEFNTTDYGGLFLNSSFGISPDVSGNVPVSIFNVTAPAIRLKWSPSDNLDFMAAVFDGNPGDADKNINGLDIKIDTEKEGLMNVFEVNYNIGNKESPSALPGVYKIGLWSHTANFSDKTDNSKNHSGNYGFYFVADQKIYKESKDQGLGLFVQFGKAPADRNEIDTYLGGGINYTGLIPGRDEDIFGVGVARAHISDDLAKAEAGGGTKRTQETTIEITYHSQLLPWLALQPDFQIVKNPSADPNKKTTNIYSLRFEIIF